MTRKLNFIPDIPNYDWIRKQMKEDLKYRLDTRVKETSLGKPLYYNINVQIVLTQECPYKCPFCLERKNPMAGQFNAEKQKESLLYILKEHPDARLTITGGEPGLYPEHVSELVHIYNKNSNQKFVCINTAGYNKNIADIAHINLSTNDFVKPNPKDFPGCTLQTVFDNKDMTIANIKKFINEHEDVSLFSFRYLSDTVKRDYNMEVFKEIKEDKDIQINTFRIGDFFIYLTFNYKGKHARITLGDMYQQKQNDYKHGYSNIIIHPDGKIGINWK